MRLKMIIACCVGLLLLLTVLPAASLATVPQQINYQGYLADSSGNPVSDGNYGMSFDIYDVSTGGVPLWSESQTVTVKDGVYNIILGQSGNPINPDIFDGDRYLGVAVGEDAEMTPRQKLTSTPFAMKAAKAESMADGAVTSVMIADGAVDSAKLSDRSVTSTKIADASLTAANIQDGAVLAEIIDNDGVGSGLDADMLDGIHASGFMQVGTDLWVNTTGDNTITGRLGVSALSIAPTWTEAVKGELSGSSPGAGVYGLAHSPTAYGVYGGADGTTGKGVYGYATGQLGRAVEGLAASTTENSALNYGGYFTANGSQGRGVYAEASGTIGYGVYGLASNTEANLNYGGYFRADGSSGRGVTGETFGTNGWGVNGFSFGSSGRGVYGEAVNTGDVNNYGGYFTAKGSSGRGVYGEASGDSGWGVYGEASNTGDVENYGGVFIARGETGRGVYGEAVAQTAENYGGYFRAHGVTGRGVYGEAWGSGGRGVYGSATGSFGWGGYFTASGNEGMGVYGEASHTSAADVTFGGYFQAAGPAGNGVYASGGRYGVFAKGGRYGVLAKGVLYDFYADGTGPSYGPFTGAHEVRLAVGFPSEIRPGIIVSVTGRTEVRRKDDGKISLSSTLPTVAISNKARDKAVFGVLVSEAPLPEDHWYESQEGERFGAVNALGEGRMLVTNINGSIEAGDYITSSEIPGYGQMQDDDLVHSYTLGKAIETVDWDSVTETVEYNGVSYKIYLIAVVYTSG